MRNDDFDRGRRSFLKRMLAFAAGVLVSLRSSSALGAQPVVQGMHEVEGDVRINNRIVKRGAPVRPDDTITTGAKSHAIFVVGKDAFLLRDNSRLELSSGTNKDKGPKGHEGVKTLRMAAGKLLSVFGRGTKTFITPTAVCGVRGTGMYVEAEADRTYVCTCYGEVELGASASPDARELVKATHHDSPRYIYAQGAKQLIEKAGMLNHTDRELIMLESLVNRRPPFVQTWPGEYRDPY